MNDEIKFVKISVDLSEDDLKTAKRVLIVLADCFELMSGELITLDKLQAATYAVKASRQLRKPVLVIDDILKRAIFH